MKRTAFIVIAALFVCVGLCVTSQVRDVSCNDVSQVGAPIPLASVMSQSCLESDTAYNGPKVLAALRGGRYGLESHVASSESRYGYTSFAGMVKALGQDGICARIDYDELCGQVRRGNPIITRITPNHLYALVQNADEKGVKLYCPSVLDGRLCLTREQFERKWGGEVIVGGSRGLSAGSSVMSPDEAAAVQAGNNCNNASGPGGAWGGFKSFLNWVGDPFNVNNGNLKHTHTDIDIPGLNGGLEVKREYRTQIFSEVEGFYPEQSSASWAVDEGRYHGYGHVSIGRHRWKSPVTIELDMCTEQPGENLLETGCINFCYHDLKHRYSFRIGKGGHLFLGKYQGTDYPTFIVDGWESDCDPTAVNRVKIWNEYGKIKIWINGKLKIDIKDESPMADASIALEAHFSHAWFDNLVVFDDGQRYEETFDQDDNEFILGYGWSLNWYKKLIDYDYYVIYLDGEGNRCAFERDGNTYKRAVGRPEELRKDAQGYTMSTKGGVVHLFDSDGYLKEIKDSNGNSTNIRYKTAGGRKVIDQVVDPAGRTLYFSYDAASNMVREIRGPGQAQVRYEYEGRDLVRVIDARGNAHEFTYWPGTHNIKTSTDREGATFHYEYFYNDQIKKITDPEGNYVQLAYLWDSVIVEDSSGQRHHYNFDTEKQTMLSDKDHLGFMRQRTWNDNQNIIREWDRNHVCMTYYEYNRWGMPGRIIDSENNETKITYDEDTGLMTSITDANGVERQYEYDEGKNLIKVWYPAKPEMVWENTYYKNGRLLGERDPLGNQTQYTYDGFGYPDTVTDALGNVTDYDYDQQGRIIREKDPYGLITQYTYDDNGNLIEQGFVGYPEYTVTYTYDRSNHRTGTYGPGNKKTEYSYTPLGEVAQVKEYDDKGQVIKTAYEYDSVGYNESAKIVCVSKTDALGNVTRYEYDASHRLTKETDPEGGVTRYGWDQEEHLRKVTDAAGISTEYIYRGEYRLERIHYADGTYEGFDYFSGGNIRSRTDCNGAMESYEYDQIGRLIKKQMLKGGTGSVAYEYDDVGRVSKIQDSEQGWIRYTYDALGRVLECDSEHTGTVKYQYDDESLTRTIIYPGGRAITYYYDTFGRTKRVEDDQGNQLCNLTFDDCGRVKELLRGNGNATRFSYDPLDQITGIDLLPGENRNTSSSLSCHPGLDPGPSRSDPRRHPELDSGSSRSNPVRDSFPKTCNTLSLSYTYDPLGRMVTRTSPKGQRSYGYDRCQRLLWSEYEDTRVETMPYDHLGNRTSLNQWGLVWDYSLNDMNQVTQSTRAPGSDRINVHGYWEDANIESITVNGVAAQIHDGYYVARDVMLVPGQNILRVIAKDKAGNTSSASVSTTYNPVGHKTYTYDKNGNRVEEHCGDDVVAYTYDEDNRLVRVDLPANSSATAWQEHFSPQQHVWWDYQMGNWYNCSIDDDGKIEIIGSTGQSWGHVATENLKINVDESNVVEIYVEGLDVGADYSIQVEPFSGQFKDIVSQCRKTGVIRGDLKTLMGWEGTHGFRINIWVGGGVGKGIDLGWVKIRGREVVSFEYDALGRRISCTQNGEFTRYVYDGENLIQEQDSQGNIQREYVYLDGIDNLLAVYHQQEVYYYVTDNIGSVIAIEDANGQTIETYEYDSFGYPQIFDTAGRYRSYSCIGNRFMFTGREWDGKIGLYYYRARHYDPGLGRFLQPDPLGYIDGLNPYVYCGNDPLTRVDRMGLCGKKYSERMREGGYFPDSMKNPFVEHYGGGGYGGYGSPPAPPYFGPGGEMVVGPGGAKYLNGGGSNVFHGTRSEAKRGGGDRLKGGRRGRRDGALRGYGKRFRRWFHRAFKKKGDPDASYRQVKDAYREWKDLGQPDR